MACERKIIVPSGRWYTPSALPEFDRRDVETAGTLPIPVGHCRRLDNQRQLQVIEYLREENRVLREQLGPKRLRFTDDQRRRLAAKAIGLGRTILAEVATLVTPETLLAWHRKLIAQK
jgi:hypothetical protein